MLDNGENVFTRETANVFQAEVIECPSCSFEFSTIHDQCDVKGIYICPACEQLKLETLMQHLKEENKKLKILLMKEREVNNFWP